MPRITRRGGSILGCVLLLLQQYYEVHAIRQTERRQQEQVISMTGELTVLAGTDYCCSNGLSTASLSASAENRRNLNTHEQHIGWSDPGDWVAYPVQLPSAGVYHVHFHVSSPFGDGGFELVDLQTQQLYGIVDTMPVTTNWDTFETISLPVALPAGLVSLQIRLLSAGWNLLWLGVNGGDSVGTLPIVIAQPPTPGVVLSPDTITTAPTFVADIPATITTMTPTASLTLNDITSLPTISTTSLGTGATPVLASTPLITISPVTKPIIAVPIPPTLIVPATTFPDDTTPKPPPYNKRPFLHEFITAENFIRTSPTIRWETSDKEQRTQAAELNTGDWLEFELDIPVAGPYLVHVRASSPSGEGSFELVHVKMMDDAHSMMNARETEISLGTFTGFPATGSWEEYGRIEHEIVLPASPFSNGLLMRIYILEPGFNLLWLYVEPSDLWEAIDARDGMK